MNNSKRINVNFSSLVGLKAELLRKQAEIQEQRSKNQVRPPPRKSKLKSKKEDLPSQDNHVEEVEDLNLLRKSSYRLQAKSRLYDQLKKSRNNQLNFLVDFENKSDDESHNSDDDLSKDVEDYENSDPEDDWVEYKDFFGRTRKCLRRDLAMMRERDRRVEREVTKVKNPVVLPNPPEEEPPVPEKEPEIEIMRRKWEEQTAKLANKADIHYQDILFDEARAHGVGYYAFSQDEEQRLKQQQNLTKLRKETEEKQKEMTELKAARDRMEKNRLKAARIRQRIRAGLPVEEEDEKEEKEEKEEKKEQEDSVPESKKEDVEVIQEPKENALVIMENKVKKFGELLGKRPKWHEMSQEEWVHKRRKDRNEEFAPVYGNFRSGGILNRKSEDSEQILDRRRSSVCEKEGSDESDDSDIIGPMPPGVEGERDRLEKLEELTPVGMESGLEGKDMGLEGAGPSAKEMDISSREEENRNVEPVEVSVGDAESILQPRETKTEEMLLNSTKDIDENKIAAGLKYLREKFEGKETE